MMRLLKSLRSLFLLLGCEDGTALVETALVAPMLILLLIGLVEVGRYADFSIKVANAARAGAQYGAQDISTVSDVPGIQSAASTDTQTNGTAIAGLQVVPTSFCTCATGSADANCDPTACPDHRIVYVQVATSLKLQTLLNYSGLPGLNGITVSGLAIMRVAQ